MKLFKRQPSIENEVLVPHSNEFKQCTRCKEFKPSEDFYQNGGGRRRSDCIDCVSNRKKALALSSLEGQETRSCSKCGETKPLDSPYFNKNGYGGFRADCRVCEKISRSKSDVPVGSTPVLPKTGRNKDTPSKSKLEMELRLLYWEKQDGCCYLCEEPLEFNDANWIVLDHHRESGRPRGLAHNSCNIIIGHAKENPERLRKMAKNIEKANQRIEVSEFKHDHTDSVFSANQPVLNGSRDLPNFGNDPSRWRK